MKDYTWKQLFIEIAALLLGLTAGLLFYVKQHSVTELTVEAGRTIYLSDLWTGDWNAAWSEAYPMIDTAKVGEYHSEIIVAGIYHYPVTVRVEDTVAPSFTLQDVEINYGDSCDASAFVLSGNDITQVEYRFEKEPDFGETGIQEVTVVATDAGGNSVTDSARLLICNVKQSVVYEYGIGIPLVRTFLISPDPEARYISAPSYLDGILPGEYEVVIEANGREYTSTLILQDTIAPRAETGKVQGWMGEELEPDAFIENIWDASEVTVSYVEEPDWYWANEQEVTLKLEDACGNVSYVEASLSLKKDNEPPIINGSSINVTVGGTISYRRSITVSDNHDAPENITLEINADNVDLGTVGEYTVYCVATDTSGNRREQEVTIHVNPVQVVTYDIDTINMLADQVLAQIITPDMTQEQKAYAIYWWAHNHIGYINHTDKGDWLKAAYEAFTTRRGDCYAYACACQALLNRVGIENMMIHKEQTPNTSQSNHFWNLVNLGNGWYHYDATPRRDGTTFYMVTDAFILAYSDSHRGSHNFTRELYPPIN